MNTTVLSGRSFPNPPDVRQALTHEGLCKTTAYITSARLAVAPGAFKISAGRCDFFSPSNASYRQFKRLSHQLLYVLYRMRLELSIRRLRFSDAEKDFLGAPLGLAAHFFLVAWAVS